MPIVYSPKAQEWSIQDPTKEELAALLLIGKQSVIEGLAGHYSNEKYKQWLTNAPSDAFFNA